MKFSKKQLVKIKTYRGLVVSNNSPVMSKIARVRIKSATPLKK